MKTETAINSAIACFKLVGVIVAALAMVAAVLSVPFAAVDDGLPGVIVAGLAAIGCYAIGDYVDRI